mgnify:FL=1|jgi:hypothetical protein
MAWCYFGSAKLITWYHFYIINAQLLEVFVHVKAKRGWKLFEIREIRVRLNGGFACSQMAAGNSYFLGINTNDFFLKDNK